MKKCRCTIGNLVHVIILETYHPLGSERRRFFKICWNLSNIVQTDGMHLKSLFLSSANTGFNTRSDGDDSVCDGMLEPEKFPYIARQSHTRVAWPWILSTILFAVISILLYFQPRTTVPCQSQSSYEGGFLTDFQDAKQVIALEQRVFDSALYFNESSRLVEMEMNSQFVGPPSPKIDLAWNNLMLGRHG